MFKLTRRRFFIGSAAVVGAGALIARPGDNSGPRDPYFTDLQDALLAAGIATPTLVIDRDRLDANIDTLLGHLPEGMGYRIVAKSLPSLDLIRHIRKRTGTDRLMTFNLPMLITLSQTMPDADQLIGKPLPVRAVQSYFEAVTAPNVTAKVQWLIDTPERLDQYAALAEAKGVDMRINIELDVGLHRGGFEPGDALTTTLKKIKESPRLTFAGFMGYEPHIPSLPTATGWRNRALEGAWATYQACLSTARDVFGADAMAHITRNAAGSPTYRYYDNLDVANEISAGSTLVKPTDFDTELLEPHVPASFIATPVIKAMDETRLPGLEFAEGAQRAMDPNVDKTVFIYGGHWLAEPVDPPGLSYNKIFGRSSNQEMLNGGPGLDVAPDDFVFLRPSQSEAVFLQFGAIAVFSNGEIVEHWPVFDASA